MDEPSVTVVILSCDRPGWLRLSLASALDQRVAALVLVSDDSQSDEVRAVAVAVDAGDRVTYRRGPRQGQLANLVSAVPFVTTRWTIVLHDDDLLDPQCVERLLRAAGDDDGPCRIVTADSSYINAEGQPIPPSNSANEHRAARFRSGINRLSFNARCHELLVEGVVSPFLATLLPTSVLQGWRPDPRVGSVLDLSLLVTLARQVELIIYEPLELVHYRIHSDSVASSYADLEPLLYVIDSILEDATFRSVWPALLHRRRDALARQARVWVAAGRWRDARALLIGRRAELSPGFLGPSLLLTLPILRSAYGRRIRRANPRFGVATR